MAAPKISMDLYMRCIGVCPVDFWSERDNGSVIIHCNKLEAERCRRLRVNGDKAEKPKAQ